MIGSKAWKFVLLVVVAIAALCAMFALGRSEFGREFRFWSVGTERVPTPDSDVDAASMRTPERKARMRGQAVVLPPADIPAANAIAQLKDTADRGSARAACRVAFELNRCYMAEQSLNAAQIFSEDDSNKTRATAKWILDSTDANASRCAGISRELYSRIYRYQTIAAQGGNPTMQRWLMQRPALVTTDFLSHLDEWADYKRRVGEYAPLAVQRKQLDDLMFLLTTYAPSLKYRPMGSTFLNDNAVFLALVDAARQNGEKLNDRLLQSETIARKSLSDDERERYEALSSDLSGKWEVGSSGASDGKSFEINSADCEQVGN